MPAAATLSETFQLLEELHQQQHQLPAAEPTFEAEGPASPLSSLGGPATLRLEHLNLFDNPLFSTAAAAPSAAVTGALSYNMATDYMAASSSNAQRPTIALWNGKTGMDYRRWSYANQMLSKATRNRLNPKKDADLHSGTEMNTVRYNIAPMSAAQSTVERIQRMFATKVQLAQLGFYPTADYPTDIYPLLYELHPNTPGITTLANERLQRHFSSIEAAARRAGLLFQSSQLDWLPQIISNEWGPQQLREAVEGHFEQRRAVAVATAAAVAAQEAPLPPGLGFPAAAAARPAAAAAAQDAVVLPEDEPSASEDGGQPPAAQEPPCCG